MLDATYNWQTAIETISTEAEQWAQQFNISKLVAEILIRQGYDDEEQIKRFLNPDATSFYDPMLINDMAKAVERIQTAIMNDQVITVYGDYDADGITSTSIVYETLASIGANVNFYIPNRFDEGYGPNEEAFQKLINAGTQLFITVDNGIAGNLAIQLAQDQGVDVVVTDHHEIPEVVPNAYALVHPRLGNDYPFGQLSGAGVAFKLVWALTEEFPAEMIELAAIGTVADVVSLTDENRAIVSGGLQSLAQTPRPGIIALAKRAGVDLEKINEEDIGFALAPRLNSLGRMGDANPGVNLLTTMDEEIAKELAKKTESANTDRKSLVDKVTKAAVELVDNQAESLPDVLVVAGSGWHQGVLGIAASRLVDRYQRPAVVLSIDDQTGLAKGSGRSIEQFDLFKGIDPVREKLVAFGGHHSAVGLTVSTDQIDMLKEQLQMAAKEQQVDLNAKPSLTVTTKIDVDDLTPDFYRNLQVLAPFGEDNPKPIFELKYRNVQSIQLIGKDKDHLKCSITGSRHQISALDFGTGDISNQLTNKSVKTRIVGQVSTNTWRGKTNLQFMISDISQERLPFVDLRTNQLHESMFQKSGVYVFFHQHLLNQLQGHLNADSVGVMFDQIDQITDDSNYYLVDCPDTSNDLLEVLQHSKPQQTTFYLYKKNLVSNLGMPDRQQYAKLFKFVKTHSNIQLDSQSEQLAKYLNLPVTTLIFMIQVFWELGFISINDKVVNVNPNYSTQRLETAPSYQLRLKQIQTEHELLEPDTLGLVDFVKQNLAG
ncbi:single-strand DNA-specific exonuclease RecJ [Lentilactobacillus senioris DSM 24302 = JCM 17472]|uniref:Single-stranded-DNA-specific exonuclease RecJ n=1 Tax=Lentilactobacillus senioris DSM 24302 = JCM 17472 TaxID=1423802 RepID=A0A0R2D0Q4_9LACO|nr:single-stranded-DNA-specific exonuclease RecJ [Lentilactobacillus senioris]KRM94025.1 single-strand DNA-specific exonuclease RecJ [Lentilactobacillus senioris DSM 24302 = JCM 17472]